MGLHFELVSIPASKRMELLTTLTAREVPDRCITKLDMAGLKQETFFMSGDEKSHPAESSSAFGSAYSIGNEASTLHHYLDQLRERHPTLTQLTIVWFLDETLSGSQSHQAELYGAILRAWHCVKARLVVVTTDTLPLQSRLPDCFLFEFIKPLCVSSIDDIILPLWNGVLVQDTKDTSCLVQAEISPLLSDDCSTQNLVEFPAHGWLELCDEISMNSIPHCYIKQSYAFTVFDPYDSLNIEKMLTDAAMSHSNEQIGLVVKLKTPRQAPPASEIKSQSDWFNFLLEETPTLQDPRSNQKGPTDDITFVAHLHSSGSVHLVKLGMDEDQKAAIAADICTVTPTGSQNGISLLKLREWLGLHIDYEEVIQQAFDNYNTMCVQYLDDSSKWPERIALPEPEKLKPPKHEGTGNNNHEPKEPELPTISFQEAIANIQELLKEVQAKPQINERAKAHKPSWATSSWSATHPEKPEPATTGSESAERCAGSSTAAFKESTSRLGLPTGNSEPPDLRTKGWPDTFLFYGAGISFHKDDKKMLDPHSHLSRNPLGFSETESSFTEESKQHRIQLAPPKQPQVAKVKSETQQLRRSPRKKSKAPDSSSLPQDKNKADATTLTAPLVSSQVAQMKSEPREASGEKPTREKTTREIRMERNRRNEEKLMKCVQRALSKQRVKRTDKGYEECKKMLYDISLASVKRLTSSVKLEHKMKEIVRSFAPAIVLNFKS